MKEERRASVTKDPVRRAQATYPSFSVMQTGWTEPYENGFQPRALWPKPDKKQGGIKATRQEEKGGRSGVQTRLVNVKETLFEEEF